MFNCLAQLTSLSSSSSTSKSRRRHLSRASSYRSVNKSESHFAPTFTCFSSLPPELRLKIWAFALPDPCVITLHYICETPRPPSSNPRSRIRPTTATAIAAAAANHHHGGTPADQPQPLGPIKEFTASRPVPALLHTCTESRELALQFYSRAFSANPTRPNSPGGPARIWVDFSRDAIHIEAEAPAVFSQLSLVMRASDRRRIKLLALTKNRRWGLPEYVCDFVGSLSNLREVVIVRQKLGESVLDGEDLREMVCGGSRNEEWRDHAVDMAVHERRSLVQWKRGRIEKGEWERGRWRVPRVRLGDCSVEGTGQGRRGIVIMP